MQENAIESSFWMVASSHRLHGNNSGHRLCGSDTFGKCLQVYLEGNITQKEVPRVEGYTGRALLSRLLPISLRTDKAPKK